MKEELVVKQATSHHVVPDTYCVTAHLPPPLPLRAPQARQHLQVRRAKLSVGIRNRCAFCPLLLTHTKTHTLSCTHTHMLAAIQNRHQDPAGAPGQRDPRLDPGPQRLRQERDAIGFSCDPPPPLFCVHPPFSLRQTIFKGKAAFITTKASTLEHGEKDGGVEIWRKGIKNKKQMEAGTPGAQRRY